MSDTPLSPQTQDLIALARDVAGRAYVPYSRFHVGAAIRAGSGALYQAPRQVPSQR